MQESSLNLKDIEVNVDFYDESEKAKLMQYPTATTMDKLVPGRLRIPTAEFLTYYFFHNIKLGIEGYRDFDSVSKRVYLHLNSIRQYFNFEDGSIRNRGTSGQEKGVTEHIGEAIGLSIINRIHGMTKADWKPIYEGKIKTFDYQLASDGKNFVQLEAKGSSGNNNRLKTSAVSKQKRRIADKKSSLNRFAKFGKDPHPASVRYGTITVVDNRSDSIVRCLITDPPSEAIEEDPKGFRLIARMSFLHNWISFISPRSAIATALATRIADLEALKNPFELDGIPLMRANREPFDYSKFGGYRKTSFMASKSQVPDGPAGGIVVQISNDELFFLGIREELLAVASNQSFEKITNYKTNVARKWITVECVFSPTRFRRLKLPRFLKESSIPIGNYHHFLLKGLLNYSPEGLVFGVLPIRKE